MCRPFVPGSTPVRSTPSIEASMELTATRADARAWIARERQKGARIAFVPTMGALHRGHLSLVERARKGADRVVMSIFVNPLQFGPSEDFHRYPRPIDRDCELAADAGVDMLFAPTVDEMYPGGEPWVTVVPDRGADRLDGASRPGHFRGVLTVVARLFGIVRPDLAVFGQKDLQQLTLIRRMVKDLEMGVEIIGAPIVREADGLALSSRNQYLSGEERSRATVLSAALRDCLQLFAKGVTDPGAYAEAMRSRISPVAELEYAEVVNPETLDPVADVESGVVCAVAARVGKTRLIDNAILGAPFQSA